VDTLEVQHCVSEVLVMRVRDPPVHLALGLPEHAGKGVRRLALDGRVRQEYGDRRQLDEDVPHVVRREEDRRTHDARRLRFPPGFPPAADARSARRASGLVRSGSDGTRTRDLRRDRPAF
jgi:hypothetical protein